jgi:hypothetical protein
MKIKKGDRVQYVETISLTINGKRKNVKVPKFGFWDGEKVILEDKEKTTVRNKEWLEKVESTIIEIDTLILTTHEL